MNRNVRRVREWLLAGLCLVPTPALADSRLSGEATIGYDSNIANVKRGAATRDDGFAALALAWDQPLRVRGGDALGVQLRFDAQSWFADEGLSNVSPSLRLRWLVRPGRSFYTPTLGVDAAAAWQEFDSRLRDAAEYRAGLFVQQPLTTRISVRLAWSASQRQASEGGVFSPGVRAASLDLDWQIGRRLVLYAGYQYRDGELVSTAADPSAAVLAASRAAAPDDVFAGETAFRLPGSADLWTAGANYSFSSRLSFDLMAREVRAEADSGARYRRTQCFASLLWRY